LNYPARALPAACYRKARIYPPLEDPACGAAGFAIETKLVFFLAGKIARSMQRRALSRMPYFFIMLNFIKKNKAFSWPLLDPTDLI
jgi:hypothetical protein